LTPIGASLCAAVVGVGQRIALSTPAAERGRVRVGAMGLVLLLSRWDAAAARYTT
jgi:hypothetical protein